MTTALKYGRVKFYKGYSYGFVKDCHSDTDYFVHRSLLANATEDPEDREKTYLRRGEYVQFEPRPDGWQREGKGPWACNVTGIAGGPLLCEKVPFEGVENINVALISQNKRLGRVKRWFPKKGYGFITGFITDGESTTDEDVFVHKSCLGTGPNLFCNSLVPGEYVEYRPVADNDRVRAHDVTGIAGGPLLGTKAHRSRHTSRHSHTSRRNSKLSNLPYVLTLEGAGLSYEDSYEDKDGFPGA